MDWKTVENITLTSEQRTAIYEGISHTKKAFENFKKENEEMRTKTSFSKFLYDRANTYVSWEIEARPHMKMTVEDKKAGLYPYILLRDTIRNILILVLPLLEKKRIFDECNFRRNISIANIARIAEEGIFDNVFAKKKIPYQGTAHPLGIENQPFGLIVSYDIEKCTIREGALLPDHSDWIFIFDTTDQVLKSNSNNVVPIDLYDTYHIDGHGIRQEMEFEEDDIPLRLKNDPTS